MKFVLTGGGTGGHVYPALAIAESLKARYDTAEFLYIGVRGRAEEEIVPELGYPISFVASAVAEDLRRQNIRYVEAFFSPADFADQGLEVQRITEAVRRGLDEQAGEPEVRLIADAIRS